MPATPRRFSRSAGGALATSSARSTVVDRDVLDLEQVARHVEVHDVAAVIAVEAEHAGAAVRGAHGAGHLLGRGRGEDVADGAGIEQALARHSR